ncbi:hypothetical protein L598_002200000400 [Mesorhizobium sp. J18]|uniref:DUF2333 family protein n=1 Tax=Mesorhizobium sp. J18 TaxID=935263 RepID=UPI00119ACE60|nr:DUF2333 family protein [Mesorhizobium sp. J18]TWG97156.1 hypothetical protein L598_002200000400 [Mesorhizobium sp. J18]
MLYAISDFFRAIGRGIGRFFFWLLSPFRAVGRWFTRRGWILRGVFTLVVLGLIGLYGYFFWQTQLWTNFNPDYVAAYNLESRNLSAGAQVAATQGAQTAESCGRSAIADVAADLTTFNVDENAWISSMILYKLGFFGLDWDRTPFFDNKASFQRGVNQAVRRTAVELVDTLGRVRGTSQIDSDLQSARESLQFSETTWYFELSPFGPKTPTPAFYRDAARKLKSFNDRLAACNATFDARADNLIQFLDRIASDLGSTSAILRERSEHHNGGWFDTRGDDRFWFAYGQLYGYYGILHAASADFHEVIRQRALGPLWDQTEEQFRAALRIQPAIISNGREDGWIMPTHLATMGFYILRARSNLVELRQVLDR